MSNRTLVRRTELLDLKVGGKYNWKNQPERLIYLGRPLMGASAGWHQFALVEKPDVVWCEVLPSDMHMLERTRTPKTPQEMEG